jgi:uroporphyrin-III C-methyltransferase
VVTATLGTLVGAAGREKVVSPALIVVGHIVSLRDRLRGEE